MILNYFSWQSLNFCWRLLIYIKKSSLSWWKSMFASRLSTSKYNDFNRNSNAFLCKTKVSSVKWRFQKRNRSLRNEFQYCPKDINLSLNPSTDVNQKKVKPLKAIEKQCKTNQNLQKTIKSSLSKTIRDYQRLSKAIKNQPKTM